jgi:hypothetical protein
MDTEVTDIEGVKGQSAGKGRKIVAVAADRTMRRSSSTG